MLNLSRNSSAAYRTVFAGSVLLLMSASGAVSANLITNGDFETGTLSGFVQSENTSNTYVATGPNQGYAGAQSGAFFALLGPLSPGTLSQTFSDMAGQNLTISFYLASNGAAPNQFTASLNDVPFFVGANLPNSSGFVRYSYENLIGTGLDTLSFTFSDPPSYFALDNVSVTQANSMTATPGPIAGAGLISLLGLAGAGFAARHRMQNEA